MTKETINQISPELIEFLHTEVITSRDKEILPQLRLEEDLWLYGDEAAEMLDRFKDQFSVNMDEFDFFKYFSQEEEWYDYFKKLASIIIPSLRMKKNKVATLTVGDLEKSIHLKILK